MHTSEPLPPLQLESMIEVLEDNEQAPASLPSPVQPTFPSHTYLQVPQGAYA